jgi:hypothetical protein
MLSKIATCLASLLCVQTAYAGDQPKSFTPQILYACTEAAELAYQVMQQRQRDDDLGAELKAIMAKYGYSQAVSAERDFVIVLAREAYSIERESTEAEQTRASIDFRSHVVRICLKME